MKKWGPDGPHPAQPPQPAQQAVLDALAADGPSGIADLAERLGLHPNTVRGHVDALLADGRVMRRKRPNGGRGRPTWVYTVAPISLEYPALAEALIGALVRARVPAEVIVDQGHGWGAELARSLEPTGVDADPLADLLRLQGFSPEPHGRDLLLTRCPLLAVAMEHENVVCALHQGVIDGVRTATGSPESALLQPFSHRDGCWVRRSG